MLFDLYLILCKHRPHKVLVIFVLKNNSQGILVCGRHLDKKFYLRPKAYLVVLLTLRLVHAQTKTNLLPELVGTRYFEIRPPRR